MASHRTRRPTRVQHSKKTRSKSTRHRPPPAPFTLWTDGPQTTEAHREAGEALEKHWAKLPADVLARILKLVKDAMNGGNMNGGK